VALGKTFANHWMHHAFVVDAEGEKMSKSIGNVSNLLDLIEHYDPRAYRLVLLQSHYRSPVKLGQAMIDAAVRALAGLDGFAARTVGVSGKSDASTIDAFRAAMDDDLDTPKAMALVFDAVRKVNIGIDAGEDVAGLVAAVNEICTAFGLELSAGSDVPDDVAAQAAALDQARADKDFAAADAIREALQSGGWIVETTKDGTSVRR
jgi:cysteinyl-tRNA synthetase